MMRLAAILCLFMMLAPCIAQAQTHVSRETANTYYQSCMGKADSRLSLNGQENLCSCAAARMMSEMTLEDLAKMSPKKGPGRAAYDKMLVRVYGPCLQPAIEDELEAECLRDRKIEQFMLRHRDKMCRCVGTKTGQYLQDKNQVIVEDILRRIPDLADLYEPLLNNADMRKQAYNNVYSCMYEANQ